MQNLLYDCCYGTASSRQTQSGLSRYIPVTSGLS